MNMNMFISLGNSSSFVRSVERMKKGRAAKLMQYQELEKKYISRWAGMTQDQKRQWLQDEHFRIFDDGRGRKERPEELIGDKGFDYSSADWLDLKRNMRVRFRATQFRTIKEEIWTEIRGCACVMCRRGGNHWEHPALKSNRANTIK